MKSLPLPNGLATLVDEDVYDWASKYKWCLTAGYPSSRRGGKKLEYLHRLVMTPPKGKVIDHISGDKLDNRRLNLRVCSHKENIQNRPKLNRNNKSGYRGVCWSKTMEKWQARVKVDYKNITVGYFDRAEEANKAISNYRSSLYA